MAVFPVLNSSVIRRAFELHHAHYGVDGWPEEHHLQLADKGVECIANNQLGGFDEIYDDLKGRWQVFRGAKEYWSSKKVKKAFRQVLADGVQQRFAEIGLRELKDKDIPALWSVLEKFRGIKTLKKDDSVVAVSKFLHFFNPRLFVIVDHGIMWKYVLDHWWLWETCEPFVEKAQGFVPETESWGGEKCALLDYLGILLWSRAILRKCPALMSTYRQHLFGTLNYPSKVAGKYESLAVEWLLLGLVEMPLSCFDGRP